MRDKYYWRQYRLDHKEELNKYDRERHKDRYVPHPRIKKTPYSKEEISRINKEQYQKSKDRRRLAYFKSRQSMFDMYGRVCTCCGETMIEFLTLEHKQGQRGKRRDGGIHAYKVAVSEYRPDLYEILCMNCNHAKGRFGYCPHERDMKV